MAKALRIRGWVRAEHWRGGKLLGVREGPNIVVDNGKNLIALRLNDDGTAPGWMATGDDGTIPGAGDSDLQGSEHDRQAFSPVASISGNEITYQRTFTAGGTISVAEIGIFNNAAAGPASGTMLARWLAAPAVDMVLNDTLAVTWVLTMG